MTVQTSDERRAVEQRANFYQFTCCWRVDDSPIPRTAFQRKERRVQLSTQDGARRRRYKQAMDQQKELTSQTNVVNEVFQVRGFRPINGAPLQDASDCQSGASLSQQQRFLNQSCNISVPRVC